MPLPSVRKKRAVAWRNVRWVRVAQINSSINSGDDERERERVRKEWSSEEFGSVHSAASADSQRGDAFGASGRRYVWVSALLCLSKLPSVK